MNELNKDRGLIPYDQKAGALTAKEKIRKDKIGAIIFWFGHRNAVVDDDIQRFRQKLMLWGRFGLYATFEIPEADQVKAEAYPAFNQVSEDLGSKLSRIKGPLASFIVATPEIAEQRSWILPLPEGIREARRQQGEEDTFVYKIIMGGTGVPFNKEGSEDPSQHFSKNDMRAHELGGVYMRYNGDYPSVSLKRLVELMNRIMGYDLPGKYFPDYSAKDIQKIAWHIKRENFNLWTPMQGAIPKYPIVNGRPVFDF